MPAATRVGEEAEAVMTTAATHAETETAITTEVDVALDLDLAHHIATTALVRSVTLVTDVNVNAVPASMAAAGMKSVEETSTSVRQHPSLPKMNGIAALYLSSSLQPVCVLAS
jgi:hypothetical protein